jgi:methionine-S-sulfoxide reductase
VLSYEELLEKWFFRLHDPTTLNRQGNDVGTQYRSAIFPQNAEQREVAERVKARVAASGKWKRPVTTSIEAASTWYSAEQYHQDLPAQAPRRIQLPFPARLNDLTPVPLPYWEGGTATDSTSLTSSLVGCR